jgi:hypothetical protein
MKRKSQILLGSLVSLFTVAACIVYIVDRPEPVANPGPASMGNAMMAGSALAPISNPAQTDPAEKAACLKRMTEERMPAEEHCKALVVPLRDFTASEQQVLVRFHKYWDCAEPLTQPGVSADPKKLDAACALKTGDTLHQISGLAFGVVGNVAKRLERQKQASAECKNALAESKRPQADIDRGKYCNLTFPDIISINMWLHRPYALGVRQMLGDVKQPPIGTPQTMRGP